jgi:CheY-like chemotaxis protein
VDDDDSYAVLLPRMLEKAEVRISLCFVGDGEQAIQYLSGDGKYTDRILFPFPALVLLDLRMPRVNGFEFLEWKNRNGELKSLPVAVWSSSELREDQEKARSLGALYYIVKPIGSELLSRIFVRLSLLLGNTAS